jgi:hypothetical protein
MSGFRADSERNRCASIDTRYVTLRDFTQRSIQDQVDNLTVGAPRLGLVWGIR